MKRILILLLALALCIPAAVLADPLPLDLTGGAPYTVKYSSDLEVYEDPTIRVERHTVDLHEEWLVTCYYAIIEIKDPSQIRTASADEANPFRSQAVKPAKAIAALKNAVFAVNGDYCAAFAGNKSTNYIMRQGTVYSESVEPSLDMLLIDEDGDFHILSADQDLAAVDKTMVDGKKVVNAFQFGPALVIDGKTYDSAGFSRHLDELRVSGTSHIVFVIGGSLGLAASVLKEADEKISFSAMTFPHQLMRIILLEQIYRAERISRNEPYDK